MALPTGYLVAWYGDDFTGSAATMEVLAFAGVPAVLFLDIPTPAQLAHFRDARAIGIASTARAKSPDWMDAHLPSAFQFLRDTGAPIIHYKVCSTLDSAPHVGSIGRAIDIGAPLIGGAWVPCLIAAPIMRRYQAFGHMFAGTTEGVFRLDRHPVMAQHPVTPMGESDVARHIAQQTHRRFGLITIEDLDSHPNVALHRETSQGADVICLDAMTQAHIASVGALIWNPAEQKFCVGSQGVEYALVAHWRKSGAIQPQDRTASAGPVAQMLAVSGSVSSVTAAQIDWAANNGFAALALDVGAAVLGDNSAEDAVCALAHAALAKGLDPLIYSARGPLDPAVQTMRMAALRGQVSIEVANERIGAALGRILARLLRETGIRRAVISGGDTSGYAARQLGLFAFSALAPTIPGAALLAAHSDDPALAGLQLALKGGQMGSQDYFGWIKRGGGVAL